MRDLCKMQIHHYTNIESLAMILKSNGKHSDVILN